MTSMIQTGKALLGAVSLTALATAATAQDDTLLIFDWSGYEEEGFFQTYLANHDSPEFAFFGEEEEAFQKLRSGFRADISHPCSQSVEKWRAAELIEPWNLDLIPNYETLAEGYKTADIFTEDGAVYFIPADLGATALLYNTEEVAEADAASLPDFHQSDLRRSHLPARQR